jgi:spore germination cell wall hydrolase CwlJ-like protein
MANSPYDGGAGTTILDTHIPYNFENVHPTPDAFGAGIARGMEELGQGAVRAAQFHEQITLQDLQNQAQTEFDGLLHGVPGKMVLQSDGTMGPDTGFLGKRGVNAANSYADFQKQTEDIRKKYSGMTQTQAQQLEFDKWAQNYTKTYMLRRAGDHYDSQYHDYAKSQNTGQAALGLSGISANAFDDNEFARRREDMRAAYVRNAQLAGKGPDGINAAVAKADEDALSARSSTILEVIKDQVYAQNDVQGAAKLFEQYKDKIDAGTRAGIARLLAPKLEDEDIDQRTRYYTGAQPQTGAVKGVSSQDRDAMIRTVIGEAGGEPVLGQQAVAWVIRNRQAADFAPTIGSVVYQRGQFEPWMTRAGELRSISESSRQYKQAAAVVDDVLSGKVADPTNGATHFYSPNVQHALGRQDPQWAYEYEPKAKIGTHVFYRDPRAVIPPEGEIKFTDRLTSTGEEIPDRLAFTKSEAIKRALADSQDKPMAFREKLVSRISKFYNDQTQAYAEERRHLVQQVPDIIKGTLEGNESLDFPDDSVRRAYPEKYEQWREEYDQAKTLGPQLKTAPWASPEELRDMVNDLGSGQGWRSELLKSHLRGIGSPDPDGDYSRMKATALNHLGQIVQARDAGMRADPAGWVSGSPEVQEKIKASLALPKEDEAGRQKAALAIVDAAWKKQGDMGVPEADRRVLTAKDAQDKVAALMDPAKSPHLLEALQKLQQTSGPQWQRVYKDMVQLGGLPATYQSVLQLDTQNADLLARALREGVGNEKQKAFSWDEALGKTANQAAQHSNKAMIDANIDGDTGKVKQYRESLIHQGVPASDDKAHPGQSVNSQLNAIKTLAYAYAYYRPGTDPAAAAEAAKKAFLDKIEFVSGARVPASDYYPVRDATKEIANAMSADNLRLPRSLVRLRFAGSASDYAAHASAAVSWANSADGTGIFALDHNNRIMRWQNGKQIAVKFSDPNGWKASAGVPAEGEEWKKTTAPNPEAEKFKEDLKAAMHGTGWPKFRRTEQSDLDSAKIDHLWTDKTIEINWDTIKSFLNSLPDSRDSGSYEEPR